MLPVDAPTKFFSVPLPERAPDSVMLFAWPAWPMVVMLVTLIALARVTAAFDPKVVPWKVAEPVPKALEFPTIKVPPVTEVPPE